VENSKHDFVKIPTKHTKVDPLNIIRKCVTEISIPDEELKRTVNVSLLKSRALKADVVNARPELAAVLPEWNDDRTKVREAMHKTKFKALEYARAQKVVE